MHWKLQVVELKVLRVLSSSTKFSGVLDYWMPYGILLYWEVPYFSIDNARVIYTKKV